jgi:hypothetical protein
VSIQEAGGERKGEAMSRRLALVTAALAVVALVLGMGLPASSSGKDDAETFRVVTVITEQEFLDLGAADFSLGDEFIFHEDLLKNGNKVGHDGGVCTVTSLEEGAPVEGGTTGEFQCEVTFWFENGQITTQYLFSEPTEFPETDTLVVTGGSGAYEGAEGHAKAVLHTATRATVTFHLDA